MDEQKPDSFITVPESFLDEVERAPINKTPGDLALLADEIRSAPWARPALRVIGRAQFAMRAWEAARDTWEAVRVLERNDIEANTLLATIYQKLDDLAASDLAPEAQTGPNPPHVLLFTGHRVDDPGRPTPRFPPGKVDIARQEIRAAIDDAIARHGNRLIGISGAASGGDILFHQECHARALATTIFLALPASEYATKSVSSAGPEWTRQYYDLLGKTPKRELQTSEDLPKWLSYRTDYTVWQRNNLWMLHNALANGSSRVTLIALWNGKAGDGPGGTAHMVDEILRRGGEVVRIGMGTVFPAE